MSERKEEYYSKTNLRHRGMVVTASQGGPLDSWAWCEHESDLPGLLPVHEGRLVYVAELNKWLFYQDGEWVDVANRPRP